MLQSTVESEELEQALAQHYYLSRDIFEELPR